MPGLCLSFIAQNRAPPRRFSKPDSLDNVNGESTNAERWVYGKISTRSSKKHHFCCVYSFCFGENRFWDSFQGVCYLAWYTTRTYDMTLLDRASARCKLVQVLKATNMFTTGLQTVGLGGKVGAAMNNTKPTGNEDRAPAGMKKKWQQHYRHGKWIQLGKTLCQVLYADDAGCPFSTC